MEGSQNQDERISNKYNFYDKHKAHHASQIAGIASSTHTFHRINVVVLAASYGITKNEEERRGKTRFTPTSAHLVALYILLIVPNLTIYMHPYDRLIIAEVSERSAAVLMTGSFAIT